MFWQLEMRRVETEGRGGREARDERILACGEKQSEDRRKNEDGEEE